MATPMERRAYELAKDSSPLRIPDPDSVRSTRPGGPSLAQSPFDPSPQTVPIEGFPAEGSERQPGMGSLAGFAQESGPNTNEVAGPKHTPQMMADNVGAMDPAPTPNWLSGKTLGPSVPRWEEQPDRGVDYDSRPPDVSANPVGKATGF